jgi:hypothetical protein
MHQYAHLATERALNIVNLRKGDKAKWVGGVAAVAAGTTSHPRGLLPWGRRSRRRAAKSSLTLYVHSLAARGRSRRLQSRKRKY